MQVSFAYFYCRLFMVNGNKTANKISVLLLANIKGQGQSITLLTLLLA